MPKSIQRHLAQTLDSLLGQTFMDFEIVISDNASTDASGEICRAYEKREADGITMTP